MSEKNREKLHLIYGIVLSALIVALGICLVLSCITIYKSGDRPFTVESISTQFKKIAWLSLLCDFAIVGGIVLSLALPLEDKKPRAIRDKKASLAKLYARAKANGVSVSCAERLKKIRKALDYSCIAICAFSALPTVFYLINADNFIGKVNDSVKALALFVLPFAAISFAAVCVKYYLGDSFADKEEKLLKSALSSDTSAKKPEIKNEKSVPVVTIVRIIVFAVTVAFIVLGIFNGGMSDVLEKAIKICTECIGLG